MSGGESGARAPSEADVDTGWDEDGAEPAANSIQPVTRDAAPPSAEPAPSDVAPESDVAARIEVVAASPTEPEPHVELSEPVTVESSEPAIAESPESATDGQEGAPPSKTAPAREARPSTWYERSSVRWVAALGIAAALVLVVASRRQPVPHATEPALRIGAAQVAAPAEPAAPPAAAAVPVPAPVPAPPAAAEASDALPASPKQNPELSAAFAAALTKTASSIAVMVRATPAGAGIYERGKRLGNDAVEINVEPGKKKILLVQLKGHRPQTFAIDGSRTDVSIELSPLPAAAPNAPAEAPAPAFDPSRDVGAL